MRFEEVYGRYRRGRLSCREAADIREGCIMEAAGTSVGASVNIGAEGSVSIVAADLVTIEVRGVSIAAMGMASDMASEDMGLD